MTKTLYGSGTFGKSSAILGAFDYHPAEENTFGQARGRQLYARPELVTGGEGVDVSQRGAESHSR
jgi:hypothetical protein